MRAASLAALACVVGLAAAVVSKPAHAQSPLDRVLENVRKLELGCAEDASRFCSSVTPGEGRLFFCILAHEDKISQKCDYALFNASRNLNRALDRVEMVADACWADIEQNCASIPEGGGRLLQCLASRANTLSAACRSSLTTLQIIR